MFVPVEMLVPPKPGLTKLSSVSAKLLIAAAESSNTKLSKLVVKALLEKKIVLTAIEPFVPPRMLFCTVVLRKAFA